MKINQENKFKPQVIKWNKKWAKNLNCCNMDGQATGGVLTINLNALRYNYKILSIAAAPAMTAAVVKADAYGLGVAYAAPALYEEGCRIFFVAQLNEALQLKLYLPDRAKIAVLNDIHPGMEATTADAGLIPVLNSLASVKAWASFCRKKKKKLPLMLQLDSGMARLGLDAGESAKLAENPEIFEYANVCYILSHLACSDEYNNDMNSIQLSSLKKKLKALPTVPVSLSNSGGINLGADYKFNLVRPGIALYGIAPKGKLSSQLHPVVKLEARVIQTRQVPAGLKIGYGGTYLTTRPTHIATVAVGYADGWIRSLSNCGAAYFSGKRLPIIGEISMDSMMLDVTALGKFFPCRGDFVELIGPSQQLEDVARDAGTIPYEILTALGHRYDRHYIQS